MAFHWIPSGNGSPQVSRTLPRILTISNIIIIIITWEFFTPVLVDGLLLNSKWQQVSSSPQDSSQYFGRYQQCCSLAVFDSSSDFQLF